MEEKSRNMTDEHLSRQLRKSKSGKLGGKLLSLVGGVVAIAGIILGGNIVLVVIGGVILGLGQMVQGKSKDKAGRQTFDAIAPDIVGAALENVQMNPAPHLLDAKDTNIPLPSHTHCSGSGYVRGTYHGLTAELCTVRLTEVDEFQREETGLWEKNEQEVYTGQWLLCELNREFPTWLTIWPRDKLDKLFCAKTIKTGNEDFDKRFNLSSDDAQAALRLLTPGRIEQILALADSSFGKFAVNLNRDGRLYLAVHSGRSFFDIGKGRETPEQLRQRFARELKWFTDMIGVRQRKGARKEYEDDVRRYTGTTMMKVVWIENSVVERWEHQEDGSDRLRRETYYLPTYEYTVNGTTYRYSSRQSLSGKRDLGRQVVGYYDPAKPECITENRPRKPVFGGAYCFLWAAFLLFFGIMTFTGQVAFS